MRPSAILRPDPERLASSARAARCGDARSALELVATRNLRNVLPGARATIGPDTASVCRVCARSAKGASTSCRSAVTELSRRRSARINLARTRTLKAPGTNTALACGDDSDDWSRGGASRGPRLDAGRAALPPDAASEFLSLSGQLHSDRELPNPLRLWRKEVEPPQRRRPRSNPSAPRKAA
jgi:hypothetical protein